MTNNQSIENKMTPNDIQLINRAKCAKDICEILNLYNIAESEEAKKKLNHMAFLLYYDEEERAGIN